MSSSSARDSFSAGTRDANVQRSSLSLNGSMHACTTPQNVQASSRESRESEARQIAAPCPSLNQSSDGQHSQTNSPVCLQRFRDNVEACSDHIQRWADEQELKAAQRQMRRRQAVDGGVHIDNTTGEVVEAKGDNVVQRKGMIAIVVAVLAWVYIVFVWRICVRGIRKEANAVASRPEGIGLLVAFHVLWLLTAWSYIKVFLTNPGFVRDHVGVSDPPLSSNNLPTTPAEEGEKAETPPNANVQGSTDIGPGVDPALPASVGPLGASIMARIHDEESLGRQSMVNEVDIDGSTKSSTRAKASPENLSSYDQGHNQVKEDLDTVPCEMAQAQKKNSEALPSAIPEPPSSRSPFPEPMRIPPESMPLHPVNMYCYRCRRIKPPRAHHCRHCGTCVLKMDHHCPWVGGCVGARNHKFFYNFLQWVTTLEIYVLIVNAVLFSRGIKRRSSDLGNETWPIDGYMVSLFPM